MARISSEHIYAKKGAQMKNQHIGYKKMIALALIPEVAVLAVVAMLFWGVRLLLN